ncbi:hypothetical protein HYH03_007352 [Edaphochlamys debaryana]|uniref:Peptidase S8/S53 domain-containing protein n=1 Tax=Edaphochlamys debaryana TaxID=47281 RepID=A0A835Y5L2_9CHLO|nr:hypothetical protein HYH03_007352 [Edaphochlamys debaryana]|eukprot:KAG2494586.1 hypothetical protein HYH03_007352 [Edaphochlamys debaryana]
MPSTAHPGALTDQAPELFLVRYQPGDGDALAAALSHTGGAAVGHVGDRTLLAYGTRHGVAAAAAEREALMGEYHATSKLCPIALRIAEAASDPRRRLRALRRAQAAGACGGGAEGAEEGCLDRPPPLLELSHVQSWHHVLYGIDPALTVDRPTVLSQTDQYRYEVRQYGVAVQMVSVLPAAALAAAAAGWPGELGAAVFGLNDTHPCWPRATAAAHGEPLLYVFMCEEDLHDGLMWLGDRGEAVWAELLNAATPLPLEQRALGGGAGGAQQLGPQAAPAAGLWRAGLHGRGEVVAVFGPCLDPALPHLADPRLPPERLRALAGAAGEAADGGRYRRWEAPEHRKVVLYRMKDRNDTGIDARDSCPAGSSVAGAVAGALAPRLEADGALPVDLGTGVAPLARVTVHDADVHDPESLYLHRPYHQLFKDHEASGALISLHSTGSASTASAAAQYTADAAALDLHLWRSPGAAHVHAAGDFADYGGGLGCTVPSEAMAKNVIAVGALEAPREGGGGWYPSLLLRLRGMGEGGAAAVLDPALGSPDWVAAVQERGSVELALAEPEDACSPLEGTPSPSSPSSSASPLAGKILIVDLDLGGCAPHERLAHAAAAGALGVLGVRPDEARAGSELEGWEPAALRGAAVRYGLVPRVQGQWMRGLLLAGLDTGLHVTATNPEAHPITPLTVARLSSYGPAPDGRIKPDLLAPGTYLAPQPDGSVRASSGSSVAAAAVVGQLALARQYFREGLYPAGRRGPESAPFTPSGMLLKAVAIAGAQSLRGSLARNTGQAPGDGPDGTQGWGAADVRQSLPLLDHAPPGYRLQVADWGAISHNESILLEGLVATGEGPITVVLTWYDYPAVPPYGPKQLVNDLDLSYRLNGEEAWRYGDGSPGAQPDRTNVIERLRLPGPPPGAPLALRVSAHDLPQRLLGGADAALPQRWALAVAGHFAGELRTGLNPAHLRPQRLPGFGAGVEQPPPQLSLALAGGACAAVDTSTPADAAAPAAPGPAPARGLVVRPQCSAGEAASFELVEQGRPYTRIVLAYGPRAGECVTAPLLRPQPCAAAGSEPNPAQLFAFEPWAGGDDLFTIQTPGGRCLAVFGAATDPGSLLALEPCRPEAPHQRFAARPHSSGAWALAPAHAPGACVGSDGGGGGAGLGGGAGGLQLEGPACGGAWEAGGGGEMVMAFRLPDIVAPGVAPPDGYRYALREGASGLCLAPPSALEPCDPAAASQQWAFTRHPNSGPESPSYQLAPFVPAAASPFTSTGSLWERAAPLCFAPSSPSGGPLALAPCDPRDAAQRWELRRPPPHLLLSLSWAAPELPNDPLQGAPNLDIQVAWSAGGQAHAVGPANARARGLLYGGDDASGWAQAGPGTEHVLFPAGPALPDTATYRVCITPRPISRGGFYLTASRGLTSQQRAPSLQVPLVTLRVYEQGTLVRTAVKMNLELPLSLTTPAVASCVQGGVGFVGSYAFTAPPTGWPGQQARDGPQASASSGGSGSGGISRGAVASPSPRPPSPSPIPPSPGKPGGAPRPYRALRSPSPALRFRAEWYSHGAPTPINMDLVVTWVVRGLAYSISAAQPSVRGGTFEGDNYAKAHNGESVVWRSESADSPDAAMYHACVRYGAAVPKGMYNVILKVFRNSGAVPKESHWTLVDTSLPSNPLTGCVPNQPGYLGNYTLARPAAGAGGGSGVPSGQGPGPGAGGVTTRGRALEQQQGQQRQGQGQGQRPRQGMASAGGAGGQQAPRQQAGAQGPDSLRLVVEWFLDGTPSNADLDLVLHWRGADGATQFLTGSSHGPVEGGRFGGDNVGRAASDEFAFWPRGVEPPHTTINVLLMWNKWTAAGVYVVFLRVLRHGALSGSRMVTIDTTEPWISHASSGLVGSVTVSSSLVTISATVTPPDGAAIDDSAGGGASGGAGAGQRSAAGTAGTPSAQESLPGPSRGSREAEAGKEAPSFGLSRRALSVSQQQGSGGAAQEGGGGSSGGGMRRRRV